MPISLQEAVQTKDSELAALRSALQQYEQKVKALGGAITLIHKPNGRHHPHSLKDPTAIVDFIVGAVGR